MCQAFGAYYGFGLHRASRGPRYRPSPPCPSAESPAPTFMTRFHNVHCSIFAGVSQRTMQVTLGRPGHLRQPESPALPGSLPHPELGAPVLFTYYRSSHWERGSQRLSISRYTILGGPPQARKEQIGAVQVNGPDLFFEGPQLPLKSLYRSPKNRYRQLERL